jgi:hypothetical protein
VGGAPSGLVFILIKDNVDQTTRVFGKLVELKRRQVGADGACRIAKARLPQHGQVEQSFDQNHSGETANGLPGEQSTFRAGEQTVGKRGADAAAVEVDGLAVVSAREGDPSAEASRPWLLIKPVSRSRSNP